MMLAAKNTPMAQIMLIREQTITLGFVFLGLPLFDMVNGFLVVRGFLPEGGLGSPSQVGRLLAILILIYFNRRSILHPFWVYVFLILFTSETLSGFRYGTANGLLVGYMTVVRFLYMYLLFITLNRYLAFSFEPIGRYLKYNLNFINLSIIAAFVTGLGNSTYGWGFGTKGFFASGNGLSIYVGVVAIVVFGMQRHRLYINVGNTTLALTFISLILIGTKTAFLLANVVFLIAIWRSRFRLVLAPIFFVALSYFSMEILEKLTIYFDVVILRLANSPSLMSFIFSGRDTYVRDAYAVLFQQDISVIRWLFGGGAFLSYQIPSFTASFDTLETDIFDVLFMYGVVGVIGYIFILCYGLRLVVGYSYLLLAMTLLSAHSIIAGHVFFNGMSSSLLIVILAIGFSLKARQDICLREKFAKYGQPQ